MYETERHTPHVRDFFYQFFFGTSVITGMEQMPVYVGGDDLMRHSHNSIHSKVV